MTTRSDSTDLRLDRDWSEFRDSGDREALARVYAAAAPRLWIVARRRLGDAHRADDAVQATFVTAITNRADFETGRHVMPWLTGILLNRVRIERRDARRTIDAERYRGERRPWHPEPGRSREQEALSRMVADAIDALPPAYRDVLSLYLDHGRSAKEIARAVGRPRGTVRSQISRGLAMLRRSLRASIAAPLAVLSLVALRLGPRRERSALSTPSEPLAKSASVRAHPSSRRVIARSLPAAAAGIAVVGLMTLATVSADRAAPVGAPALESVATHSVEDSIVRLDRRRVPGDARTRPAPERVAAGLSVHVTRPDGSPASGSVLSLLSDHPQGALFERQATTNAGGTAVFTSLASGQYLLREARGARREILVPKLGNARIELRLPGAVDVSGLVVDGDGRPLSGAELWLAPALLESDRAMKVASCDTQGHFEIADVGTDCVISARHAGHVASCWQRIGSDPGTRQRVVLRCENGPSGRLLGLVRGTDGTPLAGARVVIGALGSLDAAPLRGAIVTITDSEGSFRVDDLPVGRTPVWIGAVDRAPWWSVCDIPIDDPARVDVILSEPVTLRGHVRDENGSPIQNVLIEAGFPDLEPCQYAGPGWAYPVAVSAADGAFELIGVRPTPLGWRARRRGGYEAESDPVVPRAGAVMRWDPVLRSSRDLVADLVDSRGDALAGWCVVWSVPGSQHARTRVTTDGDGRFEIHGCSAQRATLAVLEPGSDVRTPLPLAQDVQADARRPRFVVPDALRATATVHGEIVGSPSSARVLAVWLDGGVPEPIAVAGAETGEFEIGPVPAGHYALLRTLEGIAGADVVRIELARGERRELGSWSVPPVAELSIAAHGSEPLHAVSVRTAGLALGDLRELGPDASLPILPGTYEIGTSGGVGLATTTVTLAPGTRARAELPARPGISCQVVVPPFGHTRGTIRFDWVRERDGRHAEELGTWPPPPFFSADEAVRRYVPLAPGTWQLRATDERGRVADCREHVADGTPAVFTLTAWRSPSAVRPR